MFVTMINLLPIGQLDGGHVAYALFGTRQDKFARVIHRAMLAFFFVSVGMYVLRDVRAGHAGLVLYRLGAHVGNSIFWLVWFEMLAILGTLAKARRDEKPDPSALSVRARVFATIGLVVLASLGRDHPSVLLWITWFGGLGMLLAMERKGGALRPSSLLDHPPTHLHRQTLEPTTTHRTPPRSSWANNPAHHACCPDRWNPPALGGIFRAR
jgi:hypothetical protein